MRLDPLSRNLGSGSCMRRIETAGSLCDRGRGDVHIGELGRYGQLSQVPMMPSGPQRSAKFRAVGLFVRCRLLSSVLSSRSVSSQS